MNKDKYSNLEISFKKEEEEVKNRFHKASEIIKEMSKQKKINRSTIVSISMPEDEKNFVTYIRSQIVDPGKNFYPTTSHVYRVALEYLKGVEIEEIKKVVRKFM